MKRQGIVRVEVQVRQEDAVLVRDTDEARALLRARFSARKAQGLKALLASAPLEGIDIARAT